MSSTHFSAYRPPMDADATRLQRALMADAKRRARAMRGAQQAAPPPQTPFDTCPTCEALARTVMLDQTGKA